MTILPPFDIRLTPVPKKWDFVWCSFPRQEEPHRPGFYARPCLVRSAGMATTRSGDIPWVVVIYCTKQLDLLDKHSFIIEDPEHLQQCGLFLETLVVTNRQMGLPWSPSFYRRRERDDRGPVIGRLPVELRQKVTSMIPAF